jgi:hypothetical protein
LPPSGSLHSRTYVGWVNSEGDILAGGFDHTSGQVLMEVLLHKKLQKDDHANPSVLMLQVCKSQLQVQ